MRLGIWQIGCWDTGLQEGSNGHDSETFDVSFESRVKFLNGRPKIIVLCCDCTGAQLLDEFL